MKTKNGKFKCDGCGQFKAAEQLEHGEPWEGGEYCCHPYGCGSYNDAPKEGDKVFVKFLGNLKYPGEIINIQGRKATIKMLAEGNIFVECDLKELILRTEKPIIQVGSNILFRGKFSKDFAIKGVVEVFEPNTYNPYGIRLESGNFSWANLGQLRERV